MITGQKLREFREKHRVKPVDLAKALDMDRQRIPQIEGQHEVGHEVAERFVRGVLTVHNLGAGAIIPRGIANIAAPRVQISPVLYVDGLIEPW